MTRWLFIPWVAIAAVIFLVSARNNPAGDIQSSGGGGGNSAIVSPLDLGANGQLSFGPDATGAQNANQRICIGTVNPLSDTGAGGYNGIAIGSGALINIAGDTAGDRNICIGAACSVGVDSLGRAFRNTAVGPLATSIGYRNVSLGNGAATYGQLDTAVGNFATVGGALAAQQVTQSIAIGSSATNPNNYSTALGTGATVTGDHQIMLGTSAETVVHPGPSTLTGPVSAGGTLGVTGATTLAGLTCTSAAVSGNETVSGTLGVTGASTLGSVAATSAAISGNETVGGTLGVTGATTLASLAATSAAISGNETVSGTLGVTGAATLGPLTASSATVTGNETVGGTLGVTGTSTFTGAVSAPGGLSFTGTQSQASGTLTLTGLPTAGQTFTVAANIFTAVASGATANQFNIGVDAPTTAANIAAVLGVGGNSGAINNTVIKATAVGSVVTFTSGIYGPIGNTYTLATTLSNSTVSGPTLTGGAIQDTLTGSMTLTGVSDSITLAPINGHMSMIMPAGAMLAWNGPQDLSVANNVYLGSVHPNSINGGAGSGSILIGGQAYVNGGGDRNIAIGQKTYIYAGLRSVVIGSNAASASDRAVAIGFNAGSAAIGVGQFSVALGNSTVATGSSSVALGNTASASTFLNSVAIGTNSLSTANNQITLGTIAETVRVPGAYTVPKTASYTVAAGDSGTCFTNAGIAGSVSQVFTLPTTPTVGHIECFEMTDAPASTTLAVTAGGSDTIHAPGVSGTTFTTLTTSNQYASVRLKYSKAGLWMPVSITGTWTEN